ncbi:UDP-N-acetylmuramate dehydrogenase [Ancylobacter dichloromethanicus]
MSFPDLTSELAARLPDLRGRLIANQPLAELTWFRVGGPAQVLFTPADEDDLATFLRGLPAEIPVTVIGLGSNLIVRDGGVPGVVVRLGRGFGEIAVEEGHRLRVGTAVPDVKLARAAAEAGIAGLAFYRGIPGGIGGALRMNAGAHGGETRNPLIEARGVDRAGNVRLFSNADFGFGYRHSQAPADVIFTQALFQGRPGGRRRRSSPRWTESPRPARPRSRFARRPAARPSRTRRARRPGELIDAAGCRGLMRGAAQMSTMHCNFLINTGGATAADIEGLGEDVRRRVREHSGVELEWEIKRIGLPG